MKIATNFDIRISKEDTERILKEGLLEKLNTKVEIMCKEANSQDDDWIGIDASDLDENHKLPDDWETFELFFNKNLIDQEPSFITKALTVKKLGITRYINCGKYKLGDIGIFKEHYAIITDLDNGMKELYTAKYHTDAHLDHIIAEIEKYAKMWSALGLSGNTLEVEYMGETGLTVKRQYVERGKMGSLQWQPIPNEEKFLTPRTVNIEDLFHLE